MMWCRYNSLAVVTPSKTVILASGEWFFSDRLNPVRKKGALEARYFAGLNGV